MIKKQEPRKRKGLLLVSMIAVGTSLLPIICAVVVFVVAETQESLPPFDFYRSVRFSTAILQAGFTPNDPTKSTSTIERPITSPVSISII